MKSSGRPGSRHRDRVAPFTGAWIEIVKFCEVSDTTATVAPFTGAWIEIENTYVSYDSTSQVAPFTGAWIEIMDASSTTMSLYVAPFTGAWIEISSHRKSCKKH